MKIACLQLNSTDSVAENISLIAEQIKQAAKYQVKLLCLPENCFLMASGEAFHSQVTIEASHAGVKAAKDWAKAYGMWILLGSVHVSLKDCEKYANRSILIAPTGEIAARYDKIHLFDVTIPNGESHKESNRFIAGDKAILATCDEAKLGLSICYDLRFPSLFRALAKAGAQLLTIPAAFTRFTGDKGGWHVLCRARAMETGCFVIAPAQCGTHPNGRQTYGHSLIINPWGEIIAEAGDAPMLLVADIDLEEVTKTRQTMPSLSHDREFEIVT